MSKISTGICYIQVGKVSLPGGAIVVIDMTVKPAEARWTATDIRVDVVMARGSVDTWVRSTLVNVLLTVTTTESS